MIDRTVHGVFQCQQCQHTWEAYPPAGVLDIECKCGGVACRMTPALPPEHTDVFGCECGGIMFVPGIDGLYCVSCGKFNSYDDMRTVLKPHLN